MMASSVSSRALATVRAPVSCSAIVPNAPLDVADCGRPSRAQLSPSCILTRCRPCVARQRHAPRPAAAQSSTPAGESRRRSASRVTIEFRECVRSGLARALMRPATGRPSGAGACTAASFARPVGSGACSSHLHSSLAVIPKSRRHPLGNRSLQDVVDRDDAQTSAVLLVEDRGDRQVEVATSSARSREGPSRGCTCDRVRVARPLRAWPYGSSDETRPPRPTRPRAPASSSANTTFSASVGAVAVRIALDRVGHVRVQATEQGSRGS